jgi:hypothetical protein
MQMPDFPATDNGCSDFPHKILSQKRKAAKAQRDALHLKFFLRLCAFAALR